MHAFICYSYMCVLEGNLLYSIVVRWKYAHFVYLISDPWGGCSCLRIQNIKFEGARQWPLCLARFARHPLVHSRPDQEKIASSWHQPKGTLLFWNELVQVITINTYLELHVFEHLVTKSVLYQTLCLLKSSHNLKCVQFSVF